MTNWFAGQAYAQTVASSGGARLREPLVCAALRGMRGLRPVGAVLLSLSGMACSRPALVGMPVQSVASDRGPCHGGDLELDRIVDSCTARTAAKPPPPASSLRVELLPAPGSVRSGEETTMSVKMTNLTNTPMELDVTLGCLAFEASAHNASKDDRADEEYSDECAYMGGLCGSGFPVRVTLEAKGSLRKSTVLAAKIKRLEKKGDQCVWHPARALPPGRYVVRVTLPFQDPIPGKPRSVKSRTVEGSVVVVP